MRWKALSLHTSRDESNELDALRETVFSQLVLRKIGMDPVRHQYLVRCTDGGPTLFGCKQEQC